MDFEFETFQIANFERISAFYCGENVFPVYSSRSIHTRLALSVLKISIKNLSEGRMYHIKFNECLINFSKKLS